MAGVRQIPLDSTQWACGCFEPTRGHKQPGWFPSGAVVGFMARRKAAIGQFPITPLPDYPSASPQHADGT